MRKALVTNARRYTGPDATRALLAEGLSVYCHDKSFADASARESFEGEFSGCFPLAATDPEGAVEEALGDGALDVLICNHFQKPEGVPLIETTAKGFRDSLEALLIEPYRFVHAAMPALQAGISPRIVLVTSAAGQRPMPKMTMYAAARAGAEAMVKSLAREFGGVGVSVFGIAPVFFTSDDTYPRKAFETNERFRTSVEKAVPLGRLSSENEMAKLIKHLCADESEFVTGQIIGFSGGWL